MPIRIIDTDSDYPELPEECPSREFMANMLNDGASIDLLWESRCRRCDLSQECPFYDPEADHETEHRNKLEMAVLTFRIRFAVAVFAALFFMMNLYLMLDYVAQTNQRPYHIPVWLIDIFSNAITSGLVVLSVGALVVSSAREKRKLLKSGRKIGSKHIRSR